MSARVGRVGTGILAESPRGRRGGTWQSCSTTRSSRWRTRRYDDRAEVTSHHYAFLVSEEEFDAIFARVQARNLTYWADPGHQRPNEINGNGRGFYFEDPSGHNMEVLTRAYGS